ncbi:hypothetical protein GCM10023175_32400 [Pseudonocardia xishanensis]|uniref:Secreted protein n=1 Tax=Pseudonocardia xishanensis TaxID=630995 RepID=A0ABP8RSU8_9PSEU
MLVGAAGVAAEAAGASPTITPTAAAQTTIRAVTLRAMVFMSAPVLVPRVGGGGVDPGGPSSWWMPAGPAELQRR